MTSELAKQNNLACSFSVQQGRARLKALRNFMCRLPRLRAQAQSYFSSKRKGIHESKGRKNSSTFDAIAAAAAAVADDDDV